MSDEPNDAGAGPEPAVAGHRQPRGAGMGRPERGGIPTLALATNNAQKLTELRRVLHDAGLAVEVVGLSDLPAYPEPPETEHSFEGNALIKARACVAHTGVPALADDSGLEIDVLNKMPGVRSSRWAGPECDDTANLELVLRQLVGVPEAERAARFVCVMALVLPDGTERTIRQAMEGTIAAAPRGRNGFGYDPIFLPSGETRTSAELSPVEKDAISHRGKAVRLMVPVIAELVAGHSESPHDNRQH